MIRAYLDDDLIYMTGSPSLTLTGLKYTTSATRGGSATLEMPKGHPGYGWGIWFNSILRIERDGEIEFRGRYLYPREDLYGTREMQFEGERCMLQDVLIRPGVIEGSAPAVFREVLRRYNATVSAAKQFTVGTVNPPSGQAAEGYTVEEAVTAYDLLEDLRAKYGGYFTCSTGTGGARLINWVDMQAQEPAVQEVRLTRNLIDLTRSGNARFATRLVPYGAADPVTGERLTIKSVNLGFDYIDNADARDIYGVIEATATWDNEEDPQRLKNLASAYLGTISVPVTSIDVSVVDLSVVDPNETAFGVGDTVRVISPVHGVDALMMVEEKTVDLLRPGQDRIRLGTTIRSMTAGIAEDSRASVQGMAARIKAVRAQLATVMGGTRYVKDAVNLNAVSGIGEYKITTETATTLINRPTVSGIPVIGSAVLSVSFGGKTTYSGQSCEMRWQSYRVDASGKEYMREIYVLAGGSWIGSGSWNEVDKSQYSQLTQ